MMVMLIAKEQWDGNANCSMGDIIHKIVEAFEEEENLSKAEAGPTKEEDRADDES